MKLCIGCFLQKHLCKDIGYPVKKYPYVITRQPGLLSADNNACSFHEHHYSSANGLSVLLVLQLGTAFQKAFGQPAN